MAPNIDNVPYEIKSLIYEHVDFQTMKSLRQISKSWASAGSNSLLLPEFNIKSSCDVDRLLAISASPVVAREASQTVRCVIFQSSGWEARYFRNVVCNRHEHRQGYETIDFVPNQAEMAALDELDIVIKQKDIDLKCEEDLSSFLTALRSVPRVDTVKITCQNQFTHPILRKSWEEYDLEVFRHHFAQYQQLDNIFRKLAPESGLSIKHFAHERLLSDFFFHPLIHQLTGLQTLHSLSLVISDLAGRFTRNATTPYHNLQTLISSPPHLQSLSIAFEVLGTVPARFLPPTTANTLHDLSLSGVSLDQERFFAFLEPHADTLKRLRLRLADLPTGSESWQSFLAEIRDRYGTGLEKFQLSGMVRNPEFADGHWMLFPIFDDEWGRVVTKRNGRTRELEDFVLRGGGWPMVAGDNFVTFSRD